VKKTYKQIHPCVATMLAGLLLCSSTHSFSQTATAAPPKRFSQLTMDNVPPQSAALAKEIVAISSVGLAGPYNVMLRSPVFADRMKRLLDYLRFDTRPRLDFAGRVVCALSIGTQSRLERVGCR